MRRLYMTMQIRPAQTSDIAITFWTVVLQQQTCILEDLRILKVYTQAIVRLEKVGWAEFIVVLLGVVRQNNVVGFGSAVRAGFCLVKCAHANGADVARSVVAGSDGGVLSGRGANEADFSIRVLVVVLWQHDLRNRGERLILLFSIL
jgi:hypothetical protein